jgi:hypothetical protein
MTRACQVARPAFSSSFKGGNFDALDGVYNCSMLLLHTPYPIMISGCPCHVRIAPRDQSIPSETPSHRARFSDRRASSRGSCRLLRQAFVCSRCGTHDARLNDRRVRGNSGIRRRSKGRIRFARGLHHQFTTLKIDCPTTPATSSPSVSPEAIQLVINQKE